MSHDRYTHFRERDDNPYEADNLPGYNQYQRMSHQDNDDYVKYSPKKKVTIRDIEMGDNDQFQTDEHIEMQRIKADRKRNSKG
jgi:hypothetical protein